MDAQKLFRVIVTAGILVTVVLVFSRGESVAAAPTGSGGHSLTGIVWQDFCAFDCFAGSSLRAGNGVVDLAERRQAGIKVGLSRGVCGERKIKFTARTNSVGRYRFNGLSAGTYCLSVNARQSKKAFPKPGAWTSPGGGGSALLMRYTVIVPSSGSDPQVNFGWNRAP
jgi:hypothetical protein